MYLAVVAANSENRLTKYQPFELEADAIAHVSEYGGFVSIDPEGVQALWIVDMVSKTIVRDTAVEATVTTERAEAAVQSNRRSAYQSEADALFFEEQRGEVSAGTWAAKVDEIKARYPKD